MKEMSSFSSYQSKGYQSKEDYFNKCSLMINKEFDELSAKIESQSLCVDDKIKLKKELINKLLKTI
jgi:hypothetical protein